MIKKITKSLFAVVMLLAIVFSASTFAAEKSTETKIQTSAFSYMCKDKIEQNVREIDGVVDCFLNLEDKVATITFDSSKVKIETIKNKIVNLGYDAEIVVPKNTSAEKNNSEKKILN